MFFASLKLNFSVSWQVLIAVQERSSDWSIEEWLSKHRLRCSYIFPKQFLKGTGIEESDLTGRHTIFILKLFKDLSGLFRMTSSKSWTVVVAQRLDRQPINQEVVGLNPAGCWAFFFSSKISLLNFLHPAEESSLSGPSRSCISTYDVKAKTVLVRAKQA